LTFQDIPVAEAVEASESKSWSENSQGASRIAGPEFQIKQDWETIFQV
jgi:hypothetical protein